MDKSMKSTFTFTIVCRSWALLFLGLVVMGTTGCCCISPCKNSFAPRSLKNAQCETNRVASPTLAAGPTSADRQRSQTSSAPSGLIKDIQKIVARVPSRESTNRTSTGEAPSAANAPAEKNQSSRRSILAAELANSTSVLIKDTISKPTVDQPTKPAIAESIQNHVEMQTGSGEFQAGISQLPAQSASTNLDFKSAPDSSSQSSAENLSSDRTIHVAEAASNNRRDGLASDKAPEHTIPAADSDGVEKMVRMAHANSHLMEAGTSPLASNGMTPVAPQTALDDSRSQLLLPHATVNMLKPSPTTNASDNDIGDDGSGLHRNLPSPITLTATLEKIEFPSGVSQSAELPMELQLRDKGWPAQSEIDPVQRAYQIRQAEKAQFRAWDQFATPSTNTKDSTQSSPAMRSVSHRIQRQPADASLADTWANERSNWLLETEGKTKFSGLQLQAIPQSSKVPLSPLVSLRIGDDVNRHPGWQLDAIEVQEKFQHYPIDSPLNPRDSQLENQAHPIFDVPVSDTIRRLTVRPKETDGATIDR
jgi:hypothetical protein